MYPNTKKEVFLGKRSFKAQKLTPKELLSKMAKCIISNVDVTDYDYEESDLSVSDLDEAAENVVYVIREIIECHEDMPTKFGEALLKDLYVDGAQLVGFGEEDDFIELRTLSNGFTYIKVLSTIGDDAFVPVYVVLYVGNDDKIHGYIPMYGNNVFADADVQLGAVGGNDSDAWSALLAEYDVECDTKDVFEFGKTCFETYAKKYGVQSSPIDMYYKEGEYVETLLELNLAYIEEDILSNVQLAAK